MSHHPPRGDSDASQAQPSDRVYGVRWRAKACACPSGSAASGEDPTLTGTDGPVISEVIPGSWAGRLPAPSDVGTSSGTLTGRCRIAPGGWSACSRTNRAGSVPRAPGVLPIRRVDGGHEKLALAQLSGSGAENGGPLPHSDDRQHTPGSSTPTLASTNGWDTPALRSKALSCLKDQAETTAGRMPGVRDCLPGGPIWPVRGPPRGSPSAGLCAHAPPSPPVRLRRCRLSLVLPPGRRRR
jgi:hypothetical protein